MSIPPGTRLGPYEITGPLGGGEMGAVYSALDTRLGRRVAIKTIRDDVARDAGRRERFEHEAKTIASLTHPHICTLYDVGHASLPGATEKIAFLVMELIEGETLTARLGRGPLPTHEALAIARQIADALEKAHSQGIVHRDLKPANIMLASEAASGRGPHVKLLDFGLARWRADRSVIVDEPTRTSALTGDGVVLGTLQYIAPEQLEGRAVDQRADLFAFGAILFEMIAGRPAFEAASPAPFDPARRVLTGSAVTLVEGIGFNPITYQAPFSASSDGALAYAGTSAGWELVWTDRSGRRLGIVGQPGLGYNSLCLSSDDRLLLYDLADDRMGTVDLWSLDLASGRPSRLTSDPAVDFYPVCSPKGPDVVFASLRHGIPQVLRGSTAAPGGESRILTTTAPAIPTHWSNDGSRVLYAMFSPKTNWDVWMLDLVTGKASAVVATEAEERNARLSPDGRWVTYTSNRSGRYDVWVSQYPATSASWQVSSSGGRQSDWSRDGRELFYIAPDRKLMAVDVTTGAGTFSSGATRVIADTRAGGWERTNGGLPFAMTADGQRILISNVVQQTRPITIVLNWMAGLGER